MNPRPLIVSLEKPGDSPPDDAFAVFRFGGLTAVSATDPRIVEIGLPPLANDRGTVEIWRSPDIPTTGSRDGIGFVETSGLIFGRLLIGDDVDIETATEDAYRRLLEFHREAGFSHLLRTWNYFPRITEVRDGIDRYQRFCIGRHRALSALGYDERQLPAATAIGSSAPGFLVFFLAARTPGEQIENPRQISAFRYPRQYGPQSPSFSRATLWRRDDGHAPLYISGTASIVGHESVHVGDVLAQLDEIVANLRAIIDTAHERTSTSIETPAELDLVKVYLRQVRDLPEVRKRLAEHLGDTVPVLYLRSDICRDDLLIEIEGLRA